jgi:hypothetical protein
MYGKEDSDDLNEPETFDQSIPACSRTPPSPSLRRQTRPYSRSRCYDAANGDKHTVKLYVCESGQHGFVGQAWSGRVVSIPPTRRPVRLSRHVPDHGCWAVKCYTLPCTCIRLRIH